MPGKRYNFKLIAAVAQLVERNLAKVEVESSRLFCRSRFTGEATRFPPFRIIPRSSFPEYRAGGVAEWLCSGLQSRVRRFDSDPRLHDTLWHIARHTKRTAEVKLFIYLYPWRAHANGRTVERPVSMVGPGGNVSRAGKVPMNTSDPRFSPDPHFEALKSLTRLQWMLNFEAVATVPNKAGAIAPEATPRLN